ncbi:SDR family oxidoreductase [Actinomadura sp. KC06]|nr:SDR family oxidoreductase [Actinomadura sp. KC06]
MVMTDFEGQVAVVTGGAGALGRCTARRLAGLGATVALLDVADPSAAVEETGAAFGAVADLCDEAQVDGTIGEVLSRYGRVDVLVNNAGLHVGVDRVPFWEIGAATWDRVVESNVRSAFLCAKAVAAPMRDARRGRIVNLSSDTAVFGMANFLHYVTAKAAIVGMTRALARELGPSGVAVNAVAPGAVQTPDVLAALGPDGWDDVVRGQCLTEPITSEDIAQAVCYLCGPGARIVSGQTLLVNGGANMGAF